MREFPARVCPDECVCRKTGCGLSSEHARAFSVRARGRAWQSACHDPSTWKGGFGNAIRTGFFIYERALKRRVVCVRVRLP